MVADMSSLLGLVARMNKVPQALYSFRVDRPNLNGSMRNIHRGGVPGTLNRAVRYHGNTL